MKVKELIHLLKQPGIKGNAEVEVDCINDHTIHGVVVLNSTEKQTVIITDDPEEVRAGLDQSQGDILVKIVYLNTDKKKR